MGQGTSPMSQMDPGTQAHWAKWALGPRPNGRNGPWDPGPMGQMSSGTQDQWAKWARDAGPMGQMGRDLAKLAKWETGCYTHARLPGA